MNPADVAVIAVTITSLANTAAILAGVRMLSAQLRIAAPPAPPKGTPADDGLLRELAGAVKAQRDAQAVADAGHQVGQQQGDSHDHD